MIEQGQLNWRVSSRSNGQGDCVEVAETKNAMLVRHSKDPLGGTLIFSRSEWTAFIGGAKDGEFDLV